MIFLCLRLVLLPPLALGTMTLLPDCSYVLKESGLNEIVRAATGSIGSGNGYL
jgi:hypothetical protein